MIAIKIPIGPAIAPVNVPKTRIKSFFAIAFKR